MNVSHIRNCYGCGVCAVVCTKRIIDIRLNEDGFYEPYIVDMQLCTDCGLCIEICAYNHRELASQYGKAKHSYAAWSNNAAIRRKCSSGGVGFELGRSLISSGYKVCAVRYNAEKIRAEHYVATTIEELIPSIGSKYIQSYTVDGFCEISRKQKYLITGTPCQIDSFRRYIRRFKVEDNFVLMDFFCHSVPSMLAWKKYLAMIEKKVGKVIYASWRNKQTGWHDSWNLLIKTERNYMNSRLSQGDVFYKLFLGDYCSNPACSKKCKYKYDASSADIRIGDLWGKTYQHDEDGVSAVIAYTPKGNEIVRSLNCTLIEHPFEVVAEGQMQKNCDQAYMQCIAYRMLKSNFFYNDFSWNVLFRMERLLRFVVRIIRKIG